MLAFHDSFLGATIVLSVNLVVLLNEGKQIERTLSDENDLTILNATITAIFRFNNATLSNTHGLVGIVTADVDISLALRLKSDNSVVIKARWEINMVGVSSMRQAS